MGGGSLIDGIVHRGTTALQFIINEKYGSSCFVKTPGRLPQSLPLKPGPVNTVIHLEELSKTAKTSE
jgi:hypothetical protein